LSPSKEETKLHIAKQIPKNSEEARQAMAKQFPRRLLIAKDEIQDGAKSKQDGDKSKQEMQQEINSTEEIIYLRV
jgi:hypothetical protein